MTFINCTNFDTTNFGTTNFDTTKVYLNILLSENNASHTMGPIVLVVIPLDKIVNHIQFVIQISVCV